MANEFWRELKPVAEVFRPGAAPEAYIQDAATLDERWYAPLSPTKGDFDARTVRRVLISWLRS